MGSPRTSLNLRVPWDALCVTLGIPFTSKALPIRTRCPLCRSEGLDLYDDTTSGGVWHHCRACKSSGDMIELAGQAWGLGPAATIARMVEDGIPLPDACLDHDAIAIYVEQQPGYRARMAALWDRSRQHLAVSTSKDVSLIRNRLGLRLDASPERWAAGPGRLLGALHFLDIERTFHPNAAYRPGHDTPSSPARVFKGSKWEEVLVVPYHDLPGHLRGFAFLGRQGRFPADHVYRRLNITSAKGVTERLEAGLAFTETIEMAGDARDVVAVDDWAFALQVQFRMFRGSMRPMPLVVWRDDGDVRTRRSWDMLTGRRVVFWTPRLTHRVLRQAIECDGAVSLTGPVCPDVKSIGHYLRDNPGRDLERLIMKWAKPWPDALSRWLAAAAPGEVDDLWRAIEQSGMSVSSVWDRVGGSGGVEPSTSIRPRIGVRRIVHGRNSSMCEANDTWYAEDRQGLRREVSNAVLRLTHAVKDKKDGTVWYVGEIRHKGRVVRFVERFEVLNKNTAAWMRTKMAEEGLGVLSVNPSNASRLHHIATSFHAPEFVHDHLYKWVERLRAT